MLKISLLSIGDEILIGQTINTNAAWLGAEISKLGAKVVLHSSIAGDKEIIKSEFDRLFSLSDIILVTGGLGPTHDDITKVTICEYFDDTLQIDEVTFENIKTLLTKRGRELKEVHRLQAMVPSKSKVLSNSVGTAPGMLFSSNGKYLVSMPGVPSEMKAIFNDHLKALIVSEITKHNHNVVSYLTIQTGGVPESTLAEMIGEVDTFLDSSSSLAYLPSYRGVKLRLGVQESTFEKCQTKLNGYLEYIKSRIQEYIISIGDENNLDTLIQLLKERKLTVSVAESCTGGMLGAAFTELPGSSDVFIGGELTYSNSAKKERLCVLESTIEKHGAVSQETALEMSENVRKLHNTNIGISITGIAGPDGGTPDKPVGTVWIGISIDGDNIAKMYKFGNNRAINRELSVSYAINELFFRLKK